MGSFALGCFVASSIEALQNNQTIFLYITVALVAVMVVFWKNKILRSIYASAIALILGIVFTCLYVGYLTPGDQFYREVSTEGIIIAEPVQKPTYQQLIIKVDGRHPELDSGSQEEGIPDQVRNDKKGDEIASSIDPKGPLWGNDSHNILVKAETYPVYKYGDRVKFTGTIEKVESFETDQGDIFDYPNYLLMKFKAVGIVKYPRDVEKVSSGGASKIIAGILEVKHKIEDVVSETMPEPQGALDQGLLTGTRINFTEKFEEALRRTGTTHIIAISGFNISIILAIFFAFVRRSAGYWPAIICGFLAVAIFTILTGANASIVRASIMGSLGIVAILFGRQVKIEHTIFIAAGLMIIINPLIVRFDAGFQLSFLAVLGLIYFAPKFDAWFARIPGYIKLHKSIREAVSSTFAAQMLTWPVILILFGQISIIAPLVNAIILPFIPLTMGLGFGAAIISMIIPPLSQAVSFFPWLILTGVVKLIEWAAQLPGAVITSYDFSPWWIIVWFGIVVIWLNYQYVKSQMSLLRQGYEGQAKLKTKT